MEFAIGAKLIDWFTSAWQWLRRVRVQAHRAVMLHTGDACLFVNVTNLSGRREVVVTHVWLETDPRLQVINLERPLPVRLRLDAPWETWVRIEDIPASQREASVTLARVRLSNGKILRATYRSSVPTSGFVPGGE